MICHCDVEAKNAKTGKVFCSKTEVGCDPPKDSKDSGGEFPILQILSSIFLYNSYSKRTDNVTTHFHVTARSAQKRSAGKRLPVSEKKHRKNCKCCLGHYLIVNHYSSMS